MWILADEACHFTNFSNITPMMTSYRFYIENMLLDLRSQYQISFVCSISTHNLEYRLRYCNVAQEECVTF